MKKNQLVTLKSDAQKYVEDDFQTPYTAISPLLPYLNRDFTYWECACGKGRIVQYLTQQGFKVIGSDVKEGIEFNFLTYTPPFHFDCIITNPPFSLKNEFIERCYAFNKPFALLLPLTALESRKRQKFWVKGLQLLVLPYRIHFETPSGKASYSWFPSAWFTKGLTLPSDITFSVLDSAVGLFDEEAL